MTNDLIQRKYYIVDTEDSLPSEIIDGSIYYVRKNNALYIDMSNIRHRINPDYSYKLNSNQGSQNVGKQLIIDSNGDIVLEQRIEIDDSLSKSGQAADAKVTGKAFDTLYNYYDQLAQEVENIKNDIASLKQ